MPPCCLSVFPLFFRHPFSSPPLPPDHSLFLLTSFYSHSIYFDIYLFFSFPFCSFWPPLLLFTPSVLPPPPYSSPPSSLHLISNTLPFIASGGWRATVSFNPRQCHLQTLTVTQRLHPCLTIKAVVLSKAGLGVITAAARQIEPCLI